MTKKKRELIDILLDNITPDDWPEGMPFAAQDKNKEIYFYPSKPNNEGDELWTNPHEIVCADKLLISASSLCKLWSKAIVTRDEFVKRWNERNPVVDSEGWIKWNGGEMPECSAEIQCHFVDAKSPPQDNSDGIEKVIADRGNNYGRFEDGAEIMQQLKLIVHTSQGWGRMKPIQREGMDMILHKIGRILNGDPSYVDSWIDIEGYSKLVSDWLKGTSK